MNETVWYYYEFGQQKGPVSEATLTELLRQGVVPDGTLVWRDGMSDWQPISGGVLPNEYTRAPVSPYERAASLQEGAWHSIKKVPVVLTVIFTMITAGIYYPCWFLMRRGAINSLDSHEKLGRGVFIFAIVMYSISIIVLFTSGVFEGLAEGPEDLDYIRIANTLDNCDTAISLVVGIVLLLQCFKVKRILSEHFNRHGQQATPFSGVATFFLQIFYLQYKINRL